MITSRCALHRATDYRLKTIDSASGLSSRCSKIQRQLNFFEIFDSPIGCFVLGNVFSDGFHESLGMLGSENDARFYLAFWRAWHDVDKINHKLCMRMCNDGQ